MNLRNTFLFAGIALCSAPAAWADLSLAAAKNCMSCHTIDKKVVGPAFKEISLKYAGSKEAAVPLSQKIIKGGGGVWGPVPMPANAQVNEAEARKLAQWILSLK